MYHASRAAGQMTGTLVPERSQRWLRRPGRSTAVGSKRICHLQVRHGEDVKFARRPPLRSWYAQRRWRPRCREGQRPVEQAASDLAAIGHLAQRRSASSVVVIVG